MALHTPMLARAASTYLIVVSCLMNSDKRANLYPEEQLRKRCRRAFLCAVPAAFLFSIDYRLLCVNLQFQAPPGIYMCHTVKANAKSKGCRMQMLLVHLLHFQQGGLTYVKPWLHS